MATSSYNQNNPIPNTNPLFAPITIPKNNVTGIYTSPMPTGLIPSGLKGVNATPTYGNNVPVSPIAPVQQQPLSNPVAQQTNNSVSGSNSVRQLQAQLNAQNAGKPGYIPLKVDGIMGPKTIAGQGFSYTPPPVPGSAGSIASSTGFNYAPNPTDTANQARIDSYYTEQDRIGSEVIDPTKVYNDNLANYQTQIDAYNNIYNDMLVQSRTQNQTTYDRRLGAGASLAVNQGLTGSNVGNSQISQIETANKDEQASAEAVINDKRRVEIARIMGDVRAQTDKSLEEKRLAKSKGADSYVEYLKGGVERRKTKVSSAIKALIAQGIDIEKMSTEELNSLTSGTNTSKDELVSEYKTQKKVIADATLKQEQDTMKALPASAQEYQYAVKNGYKGSFTQYQNEDANRKAAASRQPSQPTAQQFVKSAVQEMSSIINGSTDSNNFLTPSQYKDAKQRWVTSSGLPPADFDSYFADKAYTTDVDKKSPYSLQSYGISKKSETTLPTKE